jgi:hypothetical protein
VSRSIKPLFKRLWVDGQLLLGKQHFIFEVSKQHSALLCGGLRHGSRKRSMGSSERQQILREKLKTILEPLVARMPAAIHLQQAVVLPPSLALAL